MSRINKSDTRSAIRKLSDAYPPPRDSDPDRLAGLWVEVLAGLETHHLDAAISAYLKGGGSYFPRPSQIRDLALESRRESPGRLSHGDLESQYWQWEATNEGPCPVCGAVFQDLTADQLGVPALVWDPDESELVERGNGDRGETRVGIIHDPREHRAKRIGWVGPPHINERQEAR